MARSAPRTRLSIDLRREQLLDAGIGLFSERAYEEVSIDEIADACGVSRGLLYHYFRGKRDFYVSSIEHAAHRTREVDPDPSLPAAEQLRVGLENYFLSVERHAKAHSAVHRAAAADAEIAAILEEERRAFAARVLAGVPGATGGSTLAAVTARAWIGAVETAAMEWIDHPNVSSAALVSVLADALVAAMLAAARVDPSIRLPPGLGPRGRGGMIDALAAAEEAAGERS